LKILENTVIFAHRQRDKKFTRQMKVDEGKNINTKVLMLFKNLE